MFESIKSYFTKEPSVTGSSLGVSNVPGSKNASPTETKGAPGFIVYNGYLQEDEKNSKVSGHKKYITYADILANTAIVGAGVRFYLNLIAKAEWSVTPADDSAQAEEMAEFVQDVMNDIGTSWSRIIRRSAMYKFYGFSIQEWTAKIRKDGRVGISEIEPRPQHTVRRWDTDEFGRVIGVIQRSPQTQEEIYLPIQKVIYVVDDSLSDTPEGLGIFRHLAEPVDRLNRYEQLEGWGYETDLRGIPIGRAPLTQLAKLVESGEISKEAAQNIQKPLKDFISNHIKNPKLGMLLDSSPYRDEGSDAKPSTKFQWDIELLRGGNSSSQKEIANAINRITHEIAMLMGVEHLLLGRDGKGTQALSRDKSQNFYLIIDSALTEIAETYDKHFIGILWELNGFNPELKPTLSTEAVQFRDVEEISGALRDMAAAGAVLSPDDPVINEVRELLGLSPMDINKFVNDLALNTNNNPNPNPNGDVGDLGDDDNDE